MKNAVCIFVLACMAMLTTNIIFMESAFQARLTFHESVLHKHGEELVVTNEILDKVRVEQENRTKRVDMIPMLGTSPLINIATLEEDMPKLFGIMSVNPEGDISSCTPGVVAITGISEEELTNSSISRFLNERQWEEHKEYIQAAIKNGKSNLSMKREMNMFNKRIYVSVHFISSEQIFIVNIGEK
jgi:PAS domain S-box-containing protein